MLDIGLFHQLQELTCVSAQAFDVTALAFRIDRIEGQRRFPRARRPGHHDQFPARQPNLKIAQIMLSGTFDMDVGIGLHDANRQLTPYFAGARP